MNKSSIATYLIIAACSQLKAKGEDGHHLLAEDFNDETPSHFASRLLSRSQISLAEGAGPDGSNAIRVAYVGTSRGSERVIVTHGLGTQVLEATLAFDIKFDRDFQWALGGKLHGLGPQSTVTGGRHRHPAGWSARMMFKSHGRCATYLYDQDASRKWGTGLSSKKTVFTKGRWHHVVFQVRLNKPDAADGFARVLVDGRPLLESGNIMFRAAEGPETLIQKFLFCTFHGGSSPEYTPLDEKGASTTVHAYYDNFIVLEGIHQGNLAPPKREGKSTAP